MGRPRKMPSRKRIFEYWENKLDSAIDDSTCFKCGFDSYVERAHIKSVFNGGNDDCINIHLLCNNCHKKSEGFEGDVYWNWFKYEKHFITITLIKRYYKKCLIESNELALIFDNQIKERISSLGLCKFEWTINEFLKQHDYKKSDVLN